MDTIYCYSNGGLSWRLVDSEYTAQDGEVLFEGDHPTPAILSSLFADYSKMKKNGDIISQIEKIESGITIRRMTESVLGQDNGWLQEQYDAIQALRKKLK